VIATRQLGHHTTKGLVHLDLAVQGVTEQTRRARATGVDQGHARFVTRGFNA
jgi:hypothetical protein